MRRERRRYFISSLYFSLCPVFAGVCLMFASHLPHVFFCLRLVSCFLSWPEFASPLFVGCSLDLTFA